MIFTVYSNSRDQHKELGKKCDLLEGPAVGDATKSTVFTVTQHTDVTNRFNPPFEGLLRTEGWLIPILGLMTMEIYDFLHVR